ncbi:MAG: HelD family protein [Anaerotardibacter sp.]
MTLNEHDPIFEEEQNHLSETYQALLGLQESLVKKIGEIATQAAEDKENMTEDMLANLNSWDEAMETWAAFAAIDRIIEANNLSHDLNVEKLNDVRTLLPKPYFAKVELQFNPNAPAKELYIGNAGISDDDYRRLVIDWRSPVAEVYYNQDLGPTSYKANGRTINAELKLRRQFDLERDVLHAYFDTNVAIEDSLLLASLSKQRSEKMQAITATIQKEQNTVVRHEDVPVLLVNGIAGSGKTSVLLQRIAYLFYQNREDLSPEQVYLLTPNPVFSRYIDGVLPDLGEKNPQMATWEDFSGELLPEGRSGTDVRTEMGMFEVVDQAIKSLQLGENDYKDIKKDDVRFVSAQQIDKIAQKFSTIAPGPHLITLIREELLKRVNARIKQLGSSERAQNEVETLTNAQQLELFGEQVAIDSEEDAKRYATKMMQIRYASVLESVERDEWLRIDRIGMRLTGETHLDDTLWLYVKQALTGMSDASVKYVFIDEVQDYTKAQLTILARYFRRAHFLLLGDQYQAIKEGTATFPEIRELFEKAIGSVEECRLLTSYRSTPAITNLFASLLSSEEQMNISSVQRSEEEPLVRAYDNAEAYWNELSQIIDAAHAKEGLTAIIVPYKDFAKRLVKELNKQGEEKVIALDNNATLPSAGVVAMPLKLAKGLEFDRVIIPEATVQNYPDTEVSRNRLYTAISRATREVAILSKGAMTKLLKAE